MRILFKISFLSQNSRPRYVRSRTFHSGKINVLIYAFVLFSPLYRKCPEPSPKTELRTKLWDLCTFYLSISQSHLHQLQKNKI